MSWWGDVDTRSVVFLHLDKEGLSWMIRRSGGGHDTAVNPVVSTLHYCREVRYPFHNDNCARCGRCVRVCGEMWQAKALGFVGRGKERHVAFPFNRKPDFCKTCNTCIDICPMTITPCPGPMKKGEERLCGACEGQLMMATNMTDSCVWCELGKGFQCTRHVAMAGR